MEAAVGTNPVIKKKKRKSKDKNTLHLKSYIHKIGKTTFQDQKVSLSDECLVELNNIANFLITKISMQAVNVQTNYTGGQTLTANHIRAGCGLVLPECLEVATRQRAKEAHASYARSLA
jgi:hypothetical protein